MRTFEELARSLVAREVNGHLKHYCGCLWGKPVYKYIGQRDVIHSLGHYEPTGKRHSEHSRACPLRDYPLEEDMLRLLAWASGEESHTEVWEVTTQDGNRHRSLLSPGTRLAELVQIQGQPVVELRRLDPPAPRMQPIPTPGNDDERLEDF